MRALPATAGAAISYPRLPPEGSANRPEVLELLDAEFRLDMES